MSNTSNIIQTFLEEEGLHHIMWNKDRQTIHWEQMPNAMLERLLHSGYRFALVSLEGIDKKFQKWILSDNPPVASALLEVVRAQGSEWINSVQSIDKILEHSIKMHLGPHQWNEQHSFFNDANQIRQYWDYFYAYLECETPEHLAQKLMTIAKGDGAASALELLDHPWVQTYPRHGQAYKNAILAEMQTPNSVLIQGLSTSIGKNIPFPYDPEIMQALIQWMDDTGIKKQIDTIKDYTGGSANRYTIEHSFLRNQKVDQWIHDNHELLYEEKLAILSNTPVGRSYIWKRSPKDIARWLMRQSTRLDNWNDNDIACLKTVSRNPDFYNNLVEDLCRLRQINDHHQRLIALISTHTDHLYHVLSECLFSNSQTLAYMTLKTYAHALKPNTFLVSDDLGCMTPQEMAYVTLVAILYPHACIEDALQSMHSIKNIYKNIVGIYDADIARPIIKNVLNTTFGSLPECDDVAFSTDDFSLPTNERGIS